MSLIHPLAVRKDLNPRTYTDAQRKTLADARRLINEAISVRGEWGVLWRVRGEIDQFEGNIDAAIVSYQRALECSHAGQTVVARRLVRLLSARKRFAEANKILAYVGKLSATDPLGKLAQQVAVEQGDFEGALENAENDASEDPQNPANHIWLAHILEQAGQLDRAEEEYRKAVEVGPNLQQAWLLLVRHLVAKKNTVEAAEVIRQVAPQFEKEPLCWPRCTNWSTIGRRQRRSTRRLLRSIPTIRLHCTGWWTFM